MHYLCFYYVFIMFIIFVKSFTKTNTTFFGEILYFTQKNGISDTHHAIIPDLAIGNKLPN